MNKKNSRIILILGILAIISMVLYLFYDINLEIMEFALSIRTPKLFAIILASICISISTYVFQTIVSNYLITPSLLGMNSLYLLVQTSIVFVLGSENFLFTNQYISFILVLIIMSIISILLYSYLLKKTDYNIIYILLIGTVLSTLFSSMQKSMIRVMDPNEYDSLLNSLVASFSNIKSDLIFIGYILITLLLIFFRKDLKNLDVISLGRQISINLGIDYDIVSQRLLLLVSILISISTALVGPITFFGLIVISISRNIINSYRYNILLIGSALLGVVMLLFSQFIIERIFTYSIPVSVFINILGGLYFLYLLIKDKGKI